MTHIEAIIGCLEKANKEQLDKFKQAIGLTLELEEKIKRIEQLESQVAGIMRRLSRAESVTNLHQPIGTRM